MTTQTPALYRAENFVVKMLDALPHDGVVEVFGSRLPVPSEIRFGSLQAVRIYYDALADELGIGAPRVRVRRGTKKAHYEPWSATVALPPGTHARESDWAMREIIVLHEFAHHLHAARGNRGESHGAEYASVYLEVVDLRMGMTAGLMLREAFANAGVQVATSLIP